MFLNMKIVLQSILFPASACKTYPLVYHVVKSIVEWHAHINTYIPVYIYIYNYIYIIFIKFLFFNPQFIKLILTNK